MDRKQQRVAYLQQLIRAKRAQIDPDVLARAQEAAEKVQAQGKGFGAKSTTVPFDRPAATQAVERFLADHPDQKGFRARLLSFLTKSSH